MDKGKGREEEAFSVVSGEVEQERGREERLELGNISDDRIGKWSAKKQQDSRYIDSESESEAGLFVAFEEPLRNPTRSWSSSTRSSQGPLSLETHHSEKQASYRLRSASLNEFLQNITTVLVFAHEGPYQRFLEMKDAL